MKIGKGTYLQVQLKQYYEQFCSHNLKKIYIYNHIYINHKTGSRRSRKSEYTNNYEGIKSLVSIFSLGKHQL